MIREQELGIVAMEPMGEYDATVKYEKLNIVTYNGSSYCALGDTLGNDPTNKDYWQLIAKEGDKGDTYELTEEDKENIKNEITENANSGFNKNVEEKTTAFDNHVMEKTSSFDTNSLNKTNEFNANATSKLEEYNTNANARLNEYNANADGLMTIAVDTRNELERVKNDVLETGEASGNYLTLNDSTMAEYQELEVEGVCEQLTTTGKNKIGFKDSQEIILNGITASIKDGVISLNGQNTNDYVVDLFKSINVDLSTDADETYTLSYIVVSGTKDVKLGISFRDENNVQLDYIQDPTNDSLATKKTLSADTLNNTSYLYFFVRTQEILNDLEIKIQLEKGEIGTEYEPYTGGKASPSPDYPQEISVIENELKVVSCNKNLYNKDTDIKDYVYSNEGVLNSATTWNTSDWIKIISNVDYYLSCKTTNTTNILVSEFDKNKNFIQRVQFFSDTTFKYIPSERTKYIRISYKYDIGMYDLQLEENTQATSFEEHLETVINANLGNEFIGKVNDNAKDTLRVSYNEEDGEYHLYLDKNIGKVVFDGSEEWHIVSTYTNTIRVQNSTAFQGAIPDSNLISNKFLSSKASDNDDYEHIRGAYSPYENYGFIFINKARLTDSTIASFKNWLSTNNVEVFYRLATPYTVDLGVIDMPITYDEVTNLFTDSDLIPIINAKYYRNFTETVRNLQINNDTLKNELINIESRLTALENAQVSIVNESEVVE